ncbi:Arc family DNA-binding protein [Crenobacter cavernae]|uniref:Arc family DNA-binding protein n=2 Tax=Crenobacter cavernae TaxID=2290923 RepID=A0ABY0FEB9_9NEIS|nr:Arc family DNA-binding protein [Crenobacter cavernae]
MATRPATSHIAPFGLRMQPELREMLEESAVENGRSLNAEIVSRLETSFEAAGDLRKASVGELLDELFKRFPAGRLNLTIDEARKDEP